MRLILTVLARDEADVIEANIAFHLNAGVDFVIATDNASQDGTTEILESYAQEGCLHLIREPAEGLRQGEWVTRMARLAAQKFGADWVINSDADEFWWPRGPSLKEVARRSAEPVRNRAGVLALFRATPGQWRVLRGTDDGACLGPGSHQRSAELLPASDEGRAPRRSAGLRRSWQSRSDRQPASAARHLASPRGTALPLRSRAQWARKVALQGEAFTKHIARTGTGYHLTSYDALQSGRIDEQHDSMVVGELRSRRTRGRNSRRGHAAA